jgi:hypothetical protein
MATSMMGVLTIVVLIQTAKLAKNFSLIPKGEQAQTASYVNLEWCFKKKKKKTT